MKLKKIISLMAVFAILTNSLVYTAHAEGDEYIDEGGDDTNYSTDYFSPGREVNPNPILKMSSTGIYKFKQGETRDLTINIKNVSSFYAYNILIQPVPGGNDFPYEIQVLDKSNIKHHLQHTTTMPLKLRVKIDENAKDGIYPLTLNYAFSSGDKGSFSGNDTLYIKVESDSKDSLLLLKDFERTKDRVKAGEGLDISAVVENQGKGDISNVKINLDGLSAEAIGLNKGSSTHALGTVKAGEKANISYSLITNKDLKAGFYPLTYKLSYTDNKGKEQTREYGYYINVVTDKQEDEDDSTRGELTVTTTDPTGTYGVGQLFNVGLKVKNTGTKEAKNVVITAGGDKDGAVVPRSSSVKQIPSLKIGEEKAFTFSFAPTDAAGSKNYPLSFQIEYETGAKKEDVNEVRQFTQYSSVNVSNPQKKEEEKKDEKNITTPKIIISKYVCNPVIVEAGSTFDIAMTFKNTHATKAVKNIKMYLTVNEETEKQGNVFTPNQASNTYFIDEIKPKGETSHTFSMYTVPNADPRTYAINVNFEYEDSDFNKFTSTELVGINVKQKSELTTGEMIIPNQSFVGEPINVAFDLFNTGKVPLSNVMVKIVGEGIDTSTATYYAGTMEAGATDSYDGTIMVNEVGSYSGKVLITYEDSTGESFEKTQEFSMNIEEMPAYDEGDMGEEPVEEEKSTNWWLIGGIIAGVIVAIIVAVIIIRIQIRKRRERELSEDI